MRHVCFDCKCEMRRAKNGITVGNRLNSTSGEQWQHWVRSGDLHECPKCHTKVITGFGNPFVSGNAPEVFIG